MVIREVITGPFHMKINGKWLLIDEETLAKHPGGIAMTAYRETDATTAFHTFHSGSKLAYQMIEKVSTSDVDYEPSKEQGVSETLSVLSDEVIGNWNLDVQRVETINRNFNRFRIKVQKLGLFEAKNGFYFRKICEALGLMSLSVFLQLQQQYISSALILGLAWQQLGWLIHDYAHHQHFRNHYWNDLMSYIVGNLLQGFSSGGWKEQHNMHHAATNVIGRDGDIDLLPFWAVVPSDLQIHRKRAIIERLAVFLHWCMVLVQFYYLPTFQIRLIYFFTSQLFAGFLLAHVVTYNHYSTPKFKHDDPILNSYVCLQLHTTRNMRLGILIDWLWGGLNYQIEHHLFPSMPRHNLKVVMPLVKEFCMENNLPYMVNGYFEGWLMEIQQMASVAKLAE
ncbi:Delta(5) fatty acid desaturase fat-4 [Dirofilaria immitis]|nr:Delta(5) fatty acid desaturase fat-4 [Dirofilaria immitis]